MSAKTNDTIYLAVGGLAIVGAGVWAIVQQSGIANLRTPPAAPASGAAYEASAIKIVTPETRSWADAKAQKAGEKWIYDVFTPPKIYYNTQTKQFTVVPPEPIVERTGTDPVLPPPDTGFGIDLVKVEQPLFRLQLVGYVGEGAQARGNFLNVQTGAVIFGTTGKKISDLNLEIVKFSAERRIVPQPGGTTLVYTEVNAVVRDTVTGAETTLDPKSRVPEGPLVVTFKSPDGAERTVKSGESFSIGDVTYKVGDLVLDPPSAVVTREGGSLSAPETKTLVIPPPPPPPSANPEGAPPEALPGKGQPTPGAFPGF